MAQGSRKPKKRKNKKIKNRAKLRFACRFALFFFCSANKGAGDRFERLINSVQGSSSARLICGSGRKTNLCHAEQHRAELNATEERNRKAVEVFLQEGIRDLSDERL